MLQGCGKRRPEHLYTHRADVQRLHYVLLVGISGFLTVVSVCVAFMKKARACIVTEAGACVILLVCVRDPGRFVLLLTSTRLCLVRIKMDALMKVCCYVLFPG